MADIITRPIAVYLGGEVPEGTELVGNFLIGTTEQNYSTNPGGVTWYMGPDETPGHILAAPNGDTPTFWRSQSKTNRDFLSMINNIYGELGATDPFNSINDAKTWLDSNGFFYTETGALGDSLIFVNPIDGSPNWNYLIMDYTEGVSTIFDFGISTNDWLRYDLYPQNYLGYMAMFYDPNDYNHKIIFFMDSHGNIIDSYEGTGNSNYDTLDGAWLVYNDTTNGILKYFNGIDVFTYTYDPSAENNYWEWNWDATSIDGKWILTKNSLLGDNIRSHYLVGEDGNMTVITSYDTTTISSFNIYLYNEGNFFTTLTTNLSGVYSEMSMIRTSDLTITQTISIDETKNYDNYNMNLYSFSKINMVFWSNGTVDTEYLIVNYDGRNDTLIQDTHNRGDNFSTLYTFSNDPFYPDNAYGSNHFMFFFHYGNDYDTNGFLQIPYLDILYSIDDASSLTLYQYQTSGSLDKSISINQVYNSSSLFAFGDIGDGNNTIITITPTGDVVLTSIGLNSDITDRWQNLIGDDYYIIAWREGDHYTGSIFVIKGSDGTVRDTKDFTTQGNYGLSIDRDDSILVFSDDTTTWALNNQNNTFQNIGYYGSIMDLQPYYNNGQRRDSIFILFNQDTLKGRTIQKNSISDEFDLPAFDNTWDIEVGTESFLYLRDSGGIYLIGLYDVNGTLLSSITVTTNLINLYIFVDRAYAVSLDENTQIFTYWMLTPEGATSVEMLAWNGYVPNDIFVWDW